ncbi:MAG: MATE family efflux transporter [Bacteroidota bacterium]
MQQIRSYREHFKDYFAIIWPVMINLLSFAFIAAADKIMIGRLGDAQRAGATLVNQLCFIPIIFSVGICTVLPSIVAAGDVQKKYRKATDSFAYLLTICILIAFLFGSFVWLNPNILYQLKQPREAIEAVKRFYWAVTASVIPSLLVQPMRKYMEGLGYFRLNMMMSLLGGATNVLLNYFLIYGIGIFPTLGVLGAGIATLVVRLINLIGYSLFILVMVSRKGKILSLGSSWKAGFHKRFRNLLILSLPGGGELTLRVLYTGFFPQIMLGFIGLQVQSAGSILFDILRYADMISLASAITSTILMGRAFGKGVSEEQARVGITGYIINAVFSIIAIIIILLFLPNILELNKASAQIKSLVLPVVGFAFLAQFLGSLNTLGVCVLRGKQDTVVPFVINLLGFGLLGVPIGYGLGLYLQLGMRGILIGICCGFLFTSIGIFWRFADQVGLWRSHISQGSVHIE